MTDVKIILGGDRGTGKTRIFRSLFNMPLSDVSAYYPTFEPNINRISLNELTVEIWDIPGTLNHGLDDKHASLIDYKNLGGAILMFDLTRIQTYESISKWVEKVWTDSPGAPIIMVANKLDLAPTYKESKKMIKFAQNFVDKINSNTSFYCKLMEINSVKEKNALRVFNELLVSILHMKGGISSKGPKVTTTSRKMITELEERLKPVEETIPYKKPIFAEENTILSDLEKVLVNTNSNPQPATIQKITLFLKNNRDIRKTFMHLKQFYVDELINDAQSNPAWLIEENFLYLLIWKYFQQLLSQKMLVDELSVWCKQFTDIFIDDKESFSRLLDLTTKTALNLLFKFKNEPSLIETGQFEMEIYVAYRDEVYTQT